MVTLADIEAAEARVRESIYVSPCAHSVTFSGLSGNEIFFKLENLQMTGSFKERGALNRFHLLTDEERRRGVVAASAGNHAQGVAYNASRQGIRARIVMPLATPLIKVTSTRRYGAEVVLQGADYEEAEAEARLTARVEGFVFIHAFNDEAVIAGQGTIGLELLRQVPDMEAVVVPIGGGGLIGGMACALKEKNPKVRVVGVQTAKLPSMQVAVSEGNARGLDAATTIGDGIAVRRAGELTLPLVRKYVDEIVTVEEEEIANAILLLLECEKTVAEGAGAAATAALVNAKTSLRGKRVVSVVSGGNIDVNILARIIERGLVKDGRLVRLQVHVPDKVGELNRVTGVIAERRANVMEIEHDRAHFGVLLGETVVDIKLETRGPEHIEEIVGALVAAGYRTERIL